MYLPPVLRSSLINHRIAGVDVDGAMLIMFALLGVQGSLAGVSVRFLGLHKPYRRLSCGVSSCLFGLPMLSMQS